MKAPDSRWTTSTIGDLVQNAVDSRTNDYRKQAIIYGGATLIFWDSMRIEERTLLDKYHEEYTQRDGALEDGDNKKWLKEKLDDVEKKFPRGD